jgi:hypothetical protein
MNSSDCISRQITASAVVMVGRKPGDSLSIATLWVIPGQPLAAIAVPVYKALHPKAPPLVGKKSIRHAFAVPELQEEFEFLVLATSERDKNLINMRLGFVFAASNAFEEFSGKATFYRETVYQYLLRARPSKNSQKLWQGILEKQLTEYMKQSFPKSGLKTIRVSHWERL